MVGLAEQPIRRHRGASVAMVFQDPSRSLNPTMRIGAQVSEAIRAHQKLDRAAARDRALELLVARAPARGRPTASISIRTSSRAGCASAS